MSNEQDTLDRRSRLGLSHTGVRSLGHSFIQRSRGKLDASVRCDSYFLSMLTDVRLQPQCCASSPSISSRLHCRIHETTDLIQWEHKARVLQCHRQAGTTEIDRAAKNSRISGPYTAPMCQNFKAWQSRACISCLVAVFVGTHHGMLLCVTCCCRYTRAPVPHQRFLHHCEVSTPLRSCCHASVSLTRGINFSEMPQRSHVLASSRNRCCHKQSLVSRALETGAESHLHLEAVWTVY